MKRFDALLTRCEVCFVEVSDREAAAALGLVALVLLIFGLTLLIAEWRTPLTGRRRFRLPPLTFPLTLGWFMLYDAAIYAMLSLSILASPEGIDLWALLLVGGLALSAMVTFVAWGRDRVQAARGNGEHRP